MSTEAQTLDTQDLERRVKEMYREVAEEPSRSSTSRQPPSARRPSGRPANHVSDNSPIAPREITEPAWPLAPVRLGPGRGSLRRAAANGPTSGGVTPGLTSEPIRSSAPR